MAIATSQRMVSETAAYGGFVDAVGGVATVVLAVLGLVGVASDALVAIAAIVFGVALLIQGGVMLTAIRSNGRAASFGSDSIALSAMFPVGGVGIVLGILALLGISGAQLTATAVIAYGIGLMMSSTTLRRMDLQKRFTLTSAQRADEPIRVIEAIYTSAIIQAIAAVAALVLGVLALSGGVVRAGELTLVSLLVLGGALVLTGSSLSWTVLGHIPESTS